MFFLWVKFMIIPRDITQLEPKILGFFLCEVYNIPNDITQYEPKISSFFFVWSSWYSKRYHAIQPKTSTFLFFLCEVYNIPSDITQFKPAFLLCSLRYHAFWTENFFFLLFCVWSSICNIMQMEEKTSAVSSYGPNWKKKS